MNCPEIFRWKEAYRFNKYIKINQPLAKYPAICICCTGSCLFLSSIQGVGFYDWLYSVLIWKLSRESYKKIPQAVSTLKWILEGGIKNTLNKQQHSFPEMLVILFPCPCSIFRKSTTSQVWQRSAARTCLPATSTACLSSFPRSTASSHAPGACQLSE